jgi:hypothetical protein
MPEAGFEPTITASGRAKTVHALDCSATVTGINIDLRFFIPHVCIYYYTIKRGRFNCRGQTRTA